MKKYEFDQDQRELLEGLAQPLAIYQFVDNRVVTLILTDGFCELFDYEDKEQAYYYMDNDMYRMTHPDDVARIAEAAYRFATEGGTYEVVYREKKQNSSAYTIIHAVGKHVYTDTGERLAHVWYTDEGEYTEDQDQEQREDYLKRRLNEELREESIDRVGNYDYLTGLPSTSYFLKLADSWKQNTIADGETPAILYMNLSGMKYYNMQNGFEQGDILLQEFAGVLKKTFSNENCSRLGEDHFAVLTTCSHVDDVMEQFLGECRAMNDGNTVPVKIGIYPSRFENVPSSTALDRAKFACVALQDSYGSGYNYYDHALHTEAEQRNYVLSNIDRAISEKWIEVYYQPIVRAVNGKVCSEEALSRWNDPMVGFLSPNDFIPALENAGLIYKLDLYVVERVLEKILKQRDDGLEPVPHSINLSRADFVACDIVSEIEKRVDTAGIGRDMINIEITESTIGSDFDFIKSQIERFQQHGFSVWMDDYGSGYSSPDILQSIRFDLIKFDMNFVRKMDEGDSGKIILAELMRMVTALGIDSVCEGVETEEQKLFLQEIGCAMLQGFYFSKPIPLESISKRQKKGFQIGYENPKETPYYEAIGKVNLYDLAVIANENEDIFQNFFDTLPMGIMEIKDDKVEFIRTNRSYRAFMKRFFEFQLDERASGYSASPFGPGSGFMEMVKKCCEAGNKAFFDEPMPDGSVVHSFARRLGTNPVTGAKAAVIAVLSITEPSK